MITTKITTTSISRSDYSSYNSDDGSGYNIKNNYYNNNGNDEYVTAVTTAATTMRQIQLR